MRTKVFISLGSNLGNREANLRDALFELGAKCSISNVSSIYETEPVGFSDQPMFLNIVAEVITRLKPMELLSFAQSIEKKLGREKGVRWGPRVIDIDIILYGNKVVKENDLIIPHERMHERRFVLVPLVEIAPNALHPVLGKNALQLLESVPDGQSAVRFHKSFGHPD